MARSSVILSWASILAGCVPSPDVMFHGAAGAAYVRDGPLAAIVPKVMICATVSRSLLLLVVA